MKVRKFAACGAILGALIGFNGLIAPQAASAVETPPHPAELDAMIAREALRHGVPESLVRRVVMRESKYNPRARNHAFWGLMQISYPTARSMGFRGTPEQLLNPLTNLTYAVPYLANAFIAAGRREDQAVRLYASGYYDTARRRGILDLLRTADSLPLNGIKDVQVAAAPVEQAPSSGLFGALFGSSSQPEPTPVAAAPAQTVATASEANTKPASTEAVARSPAAKPAKGDGVTVLARGEQAVEKLAAFDGAQGSAKGKHAGKRGRKWVEFAQLDLPPTAQAYSASASEVAAPSQAAISDALAASSPARSAAPAPASAAPEQASAETKQTETKHKTVASHAASSAAKAKSAAVKKKPAASPAVAKAGKQADTVAALPN